MGAIESPLGLEVDASAPLPLAAQLVSQLTWLIASGVLREGDTLPSLRSLADELDINFNTVRAAYKQLDQVGLVAARRGRGTVVLGYERERALARRPNLRSHTIGVIIPAHGLFYVPFLDALEAASTDSSLFFVCDAQEDPAKARSYLDQLAAKNVDGIIVVGSLIPADADLGGVSDPPVVFADDPRATGPAVVFDHQLGSSLATRHVVDHGHRRIGFIAPPRAWANVGPKYDGFESAVSGLEDASVDVRVVSTADFTTDEGLRAATQLLSEPDPPTALVAGSDGLAFGALRAARQLGLRVPEDLAVIGNDGIELGGDLDPPLTTVEVPVAEMGYEATRMLQRLIAGEQLDQARITLEPRILVRRSCGCDRLSP